MNRRENYNACIDCDKKRSRLREAKRCFNCFQKFRIRPIEQRFWNKVRKTSGCWKWLGHKERFGYGTLSKGKKSLNMTFAHIVSWKIHFGDIPKGMKVLHRCDNPECSRPDHLWLGTQADNVRDSIKKGRFTIGERHGMSILREYQVKEIRSLYNPPLCTRKQLADKFHVSEACIKDILYRRSWAHI